VHLTLFPTDFDSFRDDALAKKWDTIRDVRRVVTGALELERAAKKIGSSLEASPLVYVSDKAIFATLFDVDLAEVCITSNAMVTNDDPPAGAFTLPDVKGVAVVVEPAVGTKCARSWKILPTVGEDPEYPDVSPRDAMALREWKALGVSVTPASPAVESTNKPVEEIKQPTIQPTNVQATPAEDNSARIVSLVTERERKKAAAADKPAEAKPAETAKAPEATAKVRKNAKARKPSAPKAEANKSKAKAAAKKAAKAKKGAAKKGATGRKAKAKKSGKAKMAVAAKAKAGKSAKSKAAKSKAAKSKTSGGGKKKTARKRRKKA
jgi:isoleucyl-tRNA synthetase